jgi:hypothetical protein
MKKGFLAIIAIAAISIATTSCDWFGASSKTSTSSVNPLIGKRQLDSLLLGKDTPLRHAFIATAMHRDLSCITFRFTQDTIFTFSKDDVDATLYRFDEISKQLQVRDSTEKPYLFARLTDSTIALRRSDSTAIILKKQ